MALPGRIVLVEGLPTLRIEFVEEKRTEDFRLVKIGQGVYELIDDRELVVNGLSVDMVLADERIVVFYLEGVNPIEVELNEVEISD